MAIINGIKTLFKSIRLARDLVLSSTAKIVSTDAKDIVIVPGTAGLVQIGDAGSTSHSLSTDDLFCSGELEVNGRTWLDSSMQIDGNLEILQNGRLTLGTGVWSAMEFDTAQTNDMTIWGLDPVSRTLIVYDRANQLTNWGAPIATNPTIRLQSATTTLAHNVQFSHDQTNYFKEIGTGGKVTNHLVPIELEDDESFTLPDATAGICELLVGDSEEYAYFAWDSSGVVDLLANSANVVTIDDDGKFCVFDSGTQVTVRNRLGATKNVMIAEMNYTTP
jgi:hypothetical protein